ncbi:hypothetical protein MUO14_17250 [Halobacillus shinanisalinarum]|uniref:DUF3951 domain-containing protein n=1 Tax=Halobacillus shinanisalinarum TaxID=2932258 RepID=A0ABY4GVP6_9BACI|nr:hypothetical protein [Halobacillus shinanisalinarum]UOQ92218.1 hypothetical protein MUO14_17250 [Halobacillus shinanisalinarum]
MLILSGILTLFGILFVLFLPGLIGMIAKKLFFKSKKGNKDYRLDRRNPDSLNQAEAKSRAYTEANRNTFGGGSGF